MQKALIWGGKHFPPWNLQDLLGIVFKEMIFNLANDRQQNFYPVSSHEGPKIPEAKALCLSIAFTFF